MRALKFGIVGIANTAADFAIFSLLTLGARLAPAGANVISYSCGIGLSFFLNRGWTFRDRNPGKPAARFAAFAVGSLVGLLLSTAVVAWLAPHWGPLPAKGASIAASFSWNYLFSNLVVFRNATGGDRAGPVPAPQRVPSNDQSHDGR
ncbi:MAG TPA: GtrA family protein [Steroidobacteraceae bacterium]|nr:GtrA family protein [Steroidobacteraceae bacterium]